MTDRPRAGRAPVPENTFFQDFEQYYKAFTNAGRVACDLSGWEHSDDAVAPDIVVDHDLRQAVRRYYADVRTTTLDEKGHVLRLFRAQGIGDISADGLTLLPTTTVATGVVLDMLKARGLHRLVADAPAYFLVLHLCKTMSIPVELVGCQTPDGPATDWETLRAAAAVPGTCIWLHQPRFAVGSDLEADRLRDLLDGTHPESSVVIDEALDDSGRAHLPADIAAASRPGRGPLFRLRSLVKPLGWNGINMACLIHPPALRDDVIGGLWNRGGTLDALGVAFLRQTCANPDRYLDVLRRTTDMLADKRRLVSGLLTDGPIRLLPGPRSYLVSLRITWPDGDDADACHRRFLSALSQARIPAMLGSHYCMPRVPGTDHVRVNLFQSMESLARGCELLSNCAARAREARPVHHET